jgi:hypothetical protein
MISKVNQLYCDSMMQLRNAYLRIKFRVRTLFTNNDKTLRRAADLKDARINKQFYDKLIARQKTFRQELLTEGIL